MQVLHFKSSGVPAGDADAELRALLAKGLANEFVLLTQDLTFMAHSNRLVGNAISPAMLPMILNPPAEIWYRQAISATLMFSAEWGPNGGHPTVLRVLSVTFSQKPTSADVQTCCQRHNAGTVAFV